MNASARARAVVTITLSALVVVSGPTGLLAGPAGADSPCTIYWTGAQSSAWQAGANWSLTDGGDAALRAPKTTDFVCMSTAPVRQSVVASAKNRAVAGIDFSATDTVTPSLELQGATFAAKSLPSVINDLTIDGGTLAGTAALTLTGDASAPADPVTIEGSQPKTIAAGATFTASTPVTVGAPTLGSQLVVDGTLDLGADLEMATDTKPTPSQVVNHGQLTLGADVAVTQSGTDGTSPEFTNASDGTISTTSGDPQISIPFTNAGNVDGAASLEVQSGNVPGSTDTGNWTLGAGGLVLDADRSATAGSFGQVTVAAGTTTFGNDVSIQGLDVDAAATVQGSPSVAVLTAGGTLSGNGTMTVAGSGSQLCDVTLAGGYRLINDGAMSYPPACGYLHLTGGSVLENAGTFTVSGGPGGDLSDDLDPANGLVNDASGTIDVSLHARSNTLNVRTPFTNDGTLSVTQGTFYPREGVTNLSAGGTLTDGSWEVSSGTIRLPVAVKTNAATISEGAAGAFNPGLRKLSNNSGALTISQDLGGDVALTNSGSVAVIAGALTRTSYTQPEGSTFVAAGADLDASGSDQSLAFDGGVVSGGGFIGGNVTSAAVVAPGVGGTGTLTISGTYAQSSAGTLQVVPGSSLLHIPGPAFVRHAESQTTLAGTLNIVAPATLPPVGTTVTVLLTSSLSGTFDTVLGQDVPAANAYWQVSYSANAVQLTLTADPTVSIADASATEGDSGYTPMIFTATLSAPSPEPVTVAYRTSNGTAIAGSDYHEAKGTVTFSPGQTSASIVVQISGDLRSEGTETFNLTLKRPTDATLGTATATGTILDNDPAR